LAPKLYAAPVKFQLQLGSHLPAFSSFLVSSPLATEMFARGNLAVAGVRQVAAARIPLPLVQQPHEPRRQHRPGPLLTLPEKLHSPEGARARRERPRRASAAIHQRAPRGQRHHGLHPAEHLRPSQPHLPQPFQQPAQRLHPAGHVAHAAAGTVLPFEQPPLRRDTPVHRRASALSTCPATVSPERSLTRSPTSRS
jgi:hypothetical protein